MAKMSQKKTVTRYKKRAVRTRSTSGRRTRKVRRVRR